MTRGNLLLVAYFLSLIVTINNNDSHNVKHLILGFGTPIIDSVYYYENNPVIGERLLKEIPYHLNDETLLDFYYEVFDSGNSISLGGSALNTIRIVNYFTDLLKVEFPEILDDSKIGFFSLMGKDKYRDYIINILNGEKISLYENLEETARTATCILLIRNKDRSIHSDISFKNISEDSMKLNENLIRDSKMFYTDAYLIKKGEVVYDFIFKTIVHEETLLVLSLGNSEVVNDNFYKLVELFPYIDVILGNEDEYNALRKLFGSENMNDSEFLIHLSESHDKINKKKNRILVVTRGKESTLIYEKDYIKGVANLFEIPIVDVDEELIVDKTGAGDSFAGAFLSGLLLGLDSKTCGYLGNKSASEVIKLAGFNIPHQLTKAHILEILQSPHRKSEL
jgi:sugar/nucleoside kinase (ribokinase family)